MNFLTQIGVLAIILIILLILIKSNQTLEKIYMEEEKEPDPGISLELPKWNFSNFGGMKKKVGKKKENRKWEREQEEEPRQEEGKVLRASDTVPVDTSSKWSVELLDDRGRTVANYRISTFPYSIGRNADNDLVLDDLSVSGYHALLEEVGGSIKLEDQGSLNKMIVNGASVTEVEVRDQMEVDFGNTRLRFHKEGTKANPTICFSDNSLMEEWY